jgi:hypothetical protein
MIQSHRKKHYGGFYQNDPFKFMSDEQQQSIQAMIREEFEKIITQI